MKIMHMRPGTKDTRRNTFDPLQELSVKKPLATIVLTREGDLFISDTANRFFPDIQNLAHPALHDCQWHCINSCELPGMFKPESSSEAAYSPAYSEQIKYNGQLYNRITSCDEFGTIRMVFISDQDISRPFLETEYTLLIKLMRLSTVLSSISKEDSLPVDHALAGVSFTAEALERYMSSYDSNSFRRAQVMHDLNNSFDTVAIFFQNLIRTGYEKIPSHLLTEVMACKQDVLFIRSALTRSFDISPEQTSTLSDLKLDKTDATFVIQNVVRLMTTSCKQKGVSLELHIADNGFYELDADLQYLISAIQNLTKNAMHAVSKGTGKIDLYLENKNEYIIIRITDNGCGIPKDKIETIFTPFITTKADKGGKGLGLFTTKQTIEAHNGLISVESQLDQGTTFTICLPSKPKEKIISKKILLVEDDLDITETLISILEDEYRADKEFAIYPAASVAAAQKLLSENQINIGIVDFHIRGGSGLDIIANSKKTEITWIITTGMSPDYVNKASIERGIDPSTLAILTKPLELDELLKKLNQIKS